MAPDGAMAYVTNAETSELTPIVTATTTRGNRFPPSAGGAEPRTVRGDARRREGVRVQLR